MFVRPVESLESCKNTINEKIDWKTLRSTQLTYLKEYEQERNYSWRTLWIFCDPTRQKHIDDLKRQISCLKDATSLKKYFFILENEKSYADRHNGEYYKASLCIMSEKLKYALRPVGRIWNKFLNLDGAKGQVPAALRKNTA